MNEDYLWDKSGEPDPEVERLEKALGSLRYRRPAEPLPLPAAAPTRRSFRLSFSPALAAAAALLFLILAGGVWLGLRRPDFSTEGLGAVADSGGAPQQEKRPEADVSGPPPPFGPGNPGEPVVAAADGGGANTAAAAPPSEVRARNKPPRLISVQRRETVKHRGPKVSPRRDELAREGEQAKAQLILALNIASDKLNTVQRKIGTSPGT